MFKQFPKISLINLRGGLLSSLLLMILLSEPVPAVPRISVLSVELDDISALPHTSEELARTASFKPLLEEALINVGAYAFIAINPQTEASENAGFGYLFRFHDVAAKLAKPFGADWVVVGQHYKASFLYSDLIVQLVNVKTSTLAASYAIELKGNTAQVTQRAMKALAVKIDGTIRRLSPT
ncbi:MAG: DUF2380 domain-containing protein [Methylococcales bacterium]